MFMSSHPLPTQSDTVPDQPVPHLLRVMYELIDIEMGLTRLAQRQAETEVEAAARLNEPAPDFTMSCTRLSRSVRRSVMLAHKLAQPAQAQTADRAAKDQVAARKQIIRVVEDSIAHDAPADEAEGLQAELLERLDSPDLQEEIAGRPVVDIITDMRRDLGLDGRLGQRPWKRRTPQEAALLCARAATKRPAVGPFNLPMPPRGWDYDNPLGARPEAAAGCRGP
jgi:hypothetical protein